MDQTKRDISSAVELVTTNPADLLKLKDRERLEIGCRADFTIFDEHVTISATYILGQAVFQKNTV